MYLRIVETDASHGTKKLHCTFLNSVEKTEFPNEPLIEISILMERQRLKKLVIQLLEAQKLSPAICLDQEDNKTFVVSVRCGLKSLKEIKNEMECFFERLLPTSNPQQLPFGMNLQY